MTDTAARARALTAALTHVAPERVEALAPAAYAAVLAALETERLAALAEAGRWIVGEGIGDGNGDLFVCTGKELAGEFCAAFGIEVPA